MMFKSFLRFFRRDWLGGKARRRPRRRPQLSVKPSPEQLEIRELLAGDIPTVIHVAPTNPADGSSPLKAPPSFVVQYSEPMEDVGQFRADDPTKYVLLNSTGVRIPITSAPFTDGAHTAVNLFYSTQLTADTYSLFVRGDKVKDKDDGNLLSQPGQLVAANAGRNSVSVGTLAGDGTVGAVGQNDEGVGNAPVAVSSADLDGDGLPDLVVIDAGNDKVHVYLGRPGTQGGGFSDTPDATLALPANSGARAVVVTDLDGDGKPDIAVANFGASNVSVFYNTTATPGNLGFSARTDLATSGPAVALAAGDLNGDGNVDLVAAVSTNPGDLNGDAVADYRVDVFRNTGTPGSPSFAAAQSVRVGDAAVGVKSPTSVVVGLFDTDGKPDLAVGGSNGITVLLNTGVGPVIAFGNPSPLISTNNVVSMAAGSLDAGSTTDIVASVSAAVAPLVRVEVLRDVGGTFNSTTYGVPGASIGGVALGDVNEDGHPDVVVANGQNVGGGFNVLLNRTLGGTISGASNSSPITITSANHGLSTGQKVYISGVNGNAAANNVGAANWTITVPAGGVSSTSADGVTDILVTTTSPHGLFTGDRVTIAGDTLGAANGTFTITVIGVPGSSTQFSLNGTASTPAGSGSGGTWTAPDLFRLNGSIANGAYTGGGTWTLSGNITTAVGNGTSDVLVTSPNHGLKTGDKITILGNSFAGFNATFTITLDPTDPNNKFTLNNTSTPAFNGSGNGGIWKDQDTYFAPSPSFFATDARPVGVAVLDTNADGHLDVVTANQNADDASLVLGNGDGTFRVATTVTAPNSLPTGLTDVVVGDLNGDGFRDMVVINNASTTASTKVTVLPGLGTGGYGAPINYSPAFTGREMRDLTSVALGDVNGDGAPDVLVTDRTDNSVGILLNRMQGKVVTASTPAGGGVITITTSAPHGLANGTQIAVSGDSLAAANGTFAITVTGPTTFTLNGTNATGGGSGGTWNSLSFTAASFTAARDIAVGDGPNSIAVGDVNQDGKLDFAVSHWSNSGNKGVSVRLGNGDGTFSTPTASESGFAGEWFDNGFYGNIVGVAIADLNNDKHPDLVALEDYRGLTYIDLQFGDGKGNFSSLTYTYAGLATPSAMAVADFNGDGYLDVASTSSATSGGFFGSDGVSVVLNQAGSGFGSPRVMSVAPGSGLQDIVAGDLNGDNHADLVVSTLSGAGTKNNVFALINTGNGTFGEPVPYQVGGAGNPTLAPTTLAMTSTSLLRISTFSLGVDLVSNGDFEEAALAGQTGTLLGWDTYKLPEKTGGSRGGWQVQTTTTKTVTDPFTGNTTTFTTSTSPLSGVDVPAPDGTYRAMLDEPNLNPYDPNNPFGSNPNAPSTYDGSHLIYQDFVLPKVGGAITDATNAAPIVIASAGHGLHDGDQVWISGVQGNTAANTTGLSSWYVKATGYDADHFALYADQALTIPVAGSGAYTGGGSWRMPFTELTLSLKLYVDTTDSATGWTNTTSNPNLPLDYTQNPSDNQQLRVDILDPSKVHDPTDSAPLADRLRYGALLGVTNESDDPNGSVLLNVFQSGNQPTTTKGTITLGPIDLTALGGQTVRLAVRTTNNQGRLIVGLDDVQLKAQLDDPIDPTLSGVALRNPGFLGSPGGATPHTNDPTIVGQVSDNTGLNGIKYVEVDVKGDGFKSDGQGGNDDVLITKFDPTGAFVLTLPTENLAASVPGIVPGQVNTIKVRAVDHSGNDSPVSTLTFFMQSNSVSEWEALGPQGVDVAVKGISYTKVSGRITAIVPDPSDPTGNTYYVGSANGGIWRTTNGGNDWTPLTDAVMNGNTPVQVPVGAMAEFYSAQNGQKIIYAATGVADREIDSRPGIGVLKGTFDANGKLTWAVVGATELGGARISKIVVSPQNPNLVYAAVASGGVTGPGVYRSTDGGLKWTNTMDLSQPNVDMRDNLGPNVTPPPITGPLGSVTDLVMDPNNPNLLLVGMGNIGLVPDSAAAGFWFADLQDGATSFHWRRQLGGLESPRVANDTLPSGINLGRVTVAMPSRPGDESITYVLIGNKPGNNTPPSVDYGNFVYDPSNGEFAGLYKTKDSFLSWTRVMLRQDIGFGEQQTGAGPPPVIELVKGSHHFVPINLLGHDSANAGSMVVDPTNSNAVYIGGSRQWDRIGEFVTDPTGISATYNLTSVSHSFVYVDTSNMVDTSSGINNGDDADKSFIGGSYDFAESSPKTANQDKYTGEGVYWYDLETAASGGTADVAGNGAPIPSTQRLLPPTITALAFDAKGRLLIGTPGGIWSGANLGFGYDLTSGGTGINAGGGFNGPQAYATPGLALTSINGNLQISDMSGVAIDPNNAGTYFTTQIDTGTAGSTAPLVWRSEGLRFPGPYQMLSIDPGIPSAGTILAASPSPGAAPGTPVTLFRVWQYADSQALRLEYSVDNGKNWLVLPDKGINGTQANQFPAFAINPTPVLKDNLYRNELLFGTNQVFLASTSAQQWHAISDPLGGPNSAISSLAIAPSKFGTITAATNASPIRITSANHGLTNGTQLLISDVEGNTAANGTRWVKVIDADHFALYSDATLKTPVAGNGAYVSGTGVWSVVKPGVYYAGLNTGEVYVADSGPFSFVQRNAGLPTGKVNGFTIDVDNQQIAYVMFDTLTAGSGHLFRTTDGGQTWTNVSANLPDVPVHALVMDKRPSLGAPNGKLYAGTEVGVYVSLDSGKSWSRLGAGSMPNAPVVSLAFDKNLEVLAAATLGRGVFSIHTGLISPVADQVMDEDTTLQVPFTVNEPPGIAPGSYTVVATAKDSNQNVITAVSLTVTPGSGASRTLTIKPAQDFNTSQTGPLTITIQVVQNNKGIGSASFHLTINPVNDVPVFVNFPGEIELTRNGPPVPINFLVNDVDNPPASLQLLPPTSSNTAVLPNSGLAIAPGPYTDGSRTLTITPPAGGPAGETTITLTLTDGSGGTTVIHVPVLLTDDAVLPFSDNFNRANSAFLGQGWNETKGDFKLQSLSGGQNLATADAGGPNIGTLRNVSVTDVVAQADFAIPKVGGYAGLIARYGGNGADTNMYFARMARSGATSLTFQLLRNNNGHWVTLGTKTIGNIGRGRMRFEVVGPSLKLFYNDVLQLAVGETARITSGGVGVRVSNGTTVDNFFADNLTLTTASLPFTDAFNNTAGDRQQLSSNWLNRLGNFSVSGGAAHANGALDLATLNGVSLVNSRVAATVALTAAGQEVGLVSRYGGPNDKNMYVAKVARTSAGIEVSIWRNLNGVWLRRAVRGVSRLGAGRLRFETVGNSLRLFLNDVLMLNVADGGLTHAGTVGMRATGGATVFDFHAETM